MGDQFMKLYDSIGPNPRIVRMFMGDLGKIAAVVELESRHLAVRIALEMVGLPKYLEEKKPEPAMIGRNAEERAECRMWTRRVDLNICEHLANGYRFGEALAFFEKRIPVAPD